MVTPPPTGPMPIERSRAANQIFHQIKSDIVTGTLQRGSKLPAERAMAEYYQVSNPTVREAVRALDLMGYVDVRHGLGAYVSADTAELIGTCLASVIRLSNLDVEQVLGIFGVLSSHAASRAAVVATHEDHDRLLASLQPIAAARTTEAAVGAIIEFHGAVAAAAHNPLLAGLLRFLARLQTELGSELAGGSFEHWHRILGKLTAVRQRLVQAIVQRDSVKAETSSREFSLKALAAITSLPGAREVRVTDPMLRKLMSSMMSRLEAS